MKGSNSVIGHVTQAELLRKNLVEKKIEVASDIFCDKMFDGLDVIQPELFLGEKEK